MIQLLSVADMRESDKTTIENGTASKELMYRAGVAIYDNVTSLSGPFAIICGNGNNAGDGYVLATLLHKVGLDCTLFRITERFSDDGRYYYDQCIALGIKDVLLPGSTANSAKIPAVEITKTILDMLSSYGTLVDCIFGTGFHGDVKEPERSVIEAINSLALSDNHTVVSVDINSGLNGDNGLCDICVHSDLTISIGNAKPGHYLASAKDVCAKLVNCDIGIKPIDNCKKIYLAEAADLKAIFAKRPHNCNKGTFGYIGLIGGSQLYSGAIRLANMAGCAMRSGAGVVKVAAPASLGNIIMPALLESTFYPLTDREGQLIFIQEEFEKLLNLSAIAFGMGIGNTEETQKALEYLIKNYQGILIIDADGINALSTMDKCILKNAKCSIIITPHPKEFSRLTGLSVEEVLCKPINAAIQFANDYSITVLLKGTSTIITDGDTTYITDRGCAGMATAGSGDVLSGIMAAVCGYNRSTPALAAVAASYVAGLAGELASKKYGDISLIASDTANHLPEAIKNIQTS